MRLDSRSGNDLEAITLKQLCFGVMQVRAM
jgi:hypothetical protein